MVICFLLVASFLHVSFAAPQQLQDCVDVTGKTVPDGEFFQVGDDPCFNCRCENGKPGQCLQAMCHPRPRDPLSNCLKYEASKYECCVENCVEWKSNQGPMELEDSCVDYKGRTIPHKDRYQPGKDPCFECHCMFGEPTGCIGAMCFPKPRDPDCVQYEASEDECCVEYCVKWKQTPTLEGCVDKDGKKADIGDWYFPDADQPCKTCRCNPDADVPLCTMIQCDVPNCPGEPIPGTCCGWKCYED